MDRYNELIAKLKKTDCQVDYGQMYAKIEEKLHRQTSFVVRSFSMAVAGSLVMLLVGVAVYYTSLSRMSNGGMVMQYVYTSNDVRDNPVADYVFYD